MIGLIEVGNGALAALLGILVTVIVLALIVARLTLRAPLTRIARIGVFFERELLAEPEPETHRIDPAEDETKIEWPRREEDG